jgi:hypothetical protein
MYSFWGNRFGRVDQVGKAYVDTEFFALRWSPLLPRRSWLVLEEDRKGVQRAVVLPLQPRSVLAGYVRSMLPVPILFLAATGYYQATQVSLYAVGLAAVWGLALGWLGHLSGEERAQRWVYARFAGDPVDVGLLAEARCHEELAAALRARIAGRASTLAPHGYRGVVDPEAQWSAIALDPRVEDEELLGAALTLARIESRSGGHAERAEMERVHGRIWDRLRAAEMARPEVPVPDADSGRWDSPIMAGIVLALSIGVAALGFHKRQPRIVTPDRRVALDEVGPPLAAGAALQAGDAVTVVQAKGGSGEEARAAEVVTKLNDAFVLVRYLPSERREVVSWASLRRRDR